MCFFVDVSVICFSKESASLAVASSKLRFQCDATSGGILSMLMGRGCAIFRGTFGITGITFKHCSAEIFATIYKLQDMFHNVRNHGPDFR